MSQYKKYRDTDNKIKTNLALLLKKYKDINKVNVKELVKQCNISRSTFYSHYQSINDVVDSIKNDYLNNIIDSMDISGIDDIELFVVNVHKYLKVNDEIIHQFFKGKNTFMFAISFADRIKEKIITAIDEELLEKYKKEIYLELSIYVDGYVMEVINYFLSDNYYLKLKDINKSILIKIEHFKQFINSLKKS